MHNRIFFFIVNNLFLYLHRERVVVVQSLVVAAIASSFFFCFCCNKLQTQCSIRSINSNTMGVWFIKVEKLGYMLKHGSTKLIPFSLYFQNVLIIIRSMRFNYLLLKVNHSKIKHKMSIERY